jgi:hypothetical protein
MLTRSSTGKLRGRPATLSALGAAVILLGGSGGSGGSGNHTTGGDSGLSAALMRIPATSSTARYVAYTDMARLRADRIVDRTAAPGQQVAPGWDLVPTLGRSTR